MPSAYLLVLIWIVSHFICARIIHRRKVHVGKIWTFLGVLLGPFAIPMALIAGHKRNT